MNVRLNVLLRRLRHVHLLPASASLILMGAAMTAFAAQPSVDLQYDPVAKAVEIRLKNESEETLNYFDTLSGESVPGFLSVRIEDPQGRILSESAISVDGFITSTSFNSNLIVPPVALTPLAPGQEVTRTVSLKSLLRGTLRYLDFDADDLTGKCLRFKLIVYTDATLTARVTRESAVSCL